MYKIYINETPLYLKDAAEVSENDRPDELNLLARYGGQTKLLLSYIDMLEKTRRFDSVTLYAKDYDQLVSDFFSLYKLVEAAGGVVYNPSNAVLFIYRRGFWDLPKGKIDQGETIAEAAVREVCEETGVGNLELGAELMQGYHTYKEKDGRRMLKRTYWFAMKTTDMTLTPQAEEGIELATWMTLSAFFSESRKVYRNILDLLALASERG